jgi:hypothetical protein
MSLTDYANITNEVRIRQGEMLRDVPNLVEAAETLTDGQFVYLTTDGKYAKASQTVAATHLVIKSGEPRLTAVEIATLTGTVQAGEPVLAVTGGPSTVDIPFAANATKGQELMVNADGFAIPRSGAAFCIGTANADVTIADGDTIAWGEAFLSLPATWRAS